MTRLFLFSFVFYPGVTLTKIYKGLELASGVGSIVGRLKQNPASSVLEGEVWRPWLGISFKLLSGPWQGNYVQLLEIGMQHY